MTMPVKSAPWQRGLDGRNKIEGRGHLWPIIRIVQMARIEISSIALVKKGVSPSRTLFLKDSVLPLLGGFIIQCDFGACR